MRPADFAAMNDPLHNPQFRRGWTDPPPWKRERRPAGNGTALKTKFNSSCAQFSRTRPTPQAQRQPNRRPIVQASDPAIFVRGPR